MPHIIIRQTRLILMKKGHPVYKTGGLNLLVIYQEGGDFLSSDSPLSGAEAKNRLPIPRL